jgi:phosphoenolpyruvate carboxylase
MPLSLAAKLQKLHKTTEETPLFNPVFQLAFDLSRQVEKQEITLDQLSDTVSELACDSLQSRSRRLHAFLQPLDENSNLTSFAKIVEHSACTLDFAAFSDIWSKPVLHCVFTAHPTFLLSKIEADAVAEAVTAGLVSPLMCSPRAKFDNISLDYEHEEAMAAIGRAMNARDKLSDVVLGIACKKFPKEWKQLRPSPFRFATWVGYDMDGRTDISWVTSIKYRLSEKADILGIYARKANELGLLEIAKDAQAAKHHAEEMVKLFSSDFESADELSFAANELTKPAPEKILSLKKMIVEIENCAAHEPSPEKAKKMLVLAAAMRTDGLGMGTIHFRLNSAQLNNAMRQHIGEEIDFELNSTSALKLVQKLIAGVKPLRSNFAALAIESTTAIRQFLAMAQILGHIDSDAEIRLLIAECEQPQTALIALYFARLFGIAEKIDISPLFETETAMEHGGRFLETLLSDRKYRKYVKARGRIAIQTGFSDAGRFVGQIPAALAIERLHSRLARTMSDHGLQDVSALMFNTHGESMGRGAHPSSMKDRLTYPMSIWARSQFKKRSIKTELEVSFQGGDGYLYFRSDDLALSTLTRIAEAELAELPIYEDPFYTRTDLSLDFYRGVRQVQRDYLNDRSYSRAISAFGLGLLKETGSRKSRRQSDLSADKDMSLRQIRAIPHNAILQQLGFPVNILTGVGTASKDDVEGIGELINQSPRAQQIFRLFMASNSLASIKSLAAYGEIFTSAYWSSRTYRGTEGHLENACLALAEKLENDDRSSQMRRLASRLRVDGLRFHRLLAQLDLGQIKEQDEDIRRQLGVLHALRICLMQHIFIKAVQIPAFSRRNDISRDDVLEMILSLRINEALELLRRAFVISAPSISDFQIDEPTDYPSETTQAYKSLHTDYFDEIEKSYELILRIGVAIANYFGAHG